MNKIIDYLPLYLLRRRGGYAPADSQSHPAQHLEDTVQYDFCLWLRSVMSTAGIPSGGLSDRDAFCHLLVIENVIEYLPLYQVGVVLRHS